ncbi:hypothetical protein [Neolewinella litorea]|uniref:Uncharacterized protein n=1 Tax=Neolewinella litorea TaxID=2562452 RepID=A0A4S4NAQ0_9BACT|nr:hypothetical protein [Neolewinella litorea]THH36412.1 hypothetical protein E4021_15115 [Neolewinella litorea]
MLFVLPVCLTGQSESDYTRALARSLGGRTEVSVTSGRVDILTDVHAIEVDWAPKWKESIGQALWYGLQTNRRAGIILILRDPGDRKYFIQLNAALTHGGLEGKIKTWVYPDDFPDITPESRAAAPEQPAADQQYWLSTNSGKRHRRGCRWFAESRGRYCTVEEGVAAQCCH